MQICTRSALQICMGRCRSAPDLHHICTADLHRGCRSAPDLHHICTADLHGGCRSAPHLHHICTADLHSYMQICTAHLQICTADLHSYMQICSADLHSSKMINLIFYNNALQVHFTNTNFTKVCLGIYIKESS